MPPRFLQIESSDGFTFIISREAALVSGTIRGMLNNEQFEESQTGKLRLDMDATILAKVCDYFYFNLRYTATQGNAKFEVPPQLALELLVAADYLDA